MSSLAGKVALVTGAGTGIGAATAILLADRGVKVALLGIESDKIEDICAQIKANDGEAIAITADVSCSGDVETAVGKTIEAFGALHFGVNCAGVSSGAVPTGEVTPEDWQAITKVNLDGVFYSMRYQIPEIINSGGGAIVNISSVFGHRGLPSRSGYTASKYGVIGLSRAAAIEYATKNIRVNVICPGVIDTPMLDADREQVGQFTQAIPMQRLGRPEELATSIAFLLSDEASYITGTELVVDGGFLT